MSEFGPWKSAPGAPFLEVIDFEATKYGGCIVWNRHLVGWAHSYTPLHWLKESMSLLSFWCHFVCRTYWLSGDVESIRRWGCNFFQPWEGLNCWAWMVLKTRLNNGRWTDPNLNWWVAAGFLNHQYWWMEPWNFMKLPGGGGKGIRMSKNKEELEQNFVQVQHLGEKANSSCQISLPASF